MIAYETYQERPGRLDSTHGAQTQTTTSKPVLVVDSARMARRQAWLEARAEARAEAWVDSLRLDSLRVDSLAGVARAEALQRALPYPVYCTADSLATKGSLGGMYFREVPAAEVYGTASTLVSTRVSWLKPTHSLTESPVFQVLVLLLAATYAMLLYHHLGDILSLLTRISRDKPAGSRLSEDHGSGGVSGFLNIATAIGMLFIGIMAVKYSDSLIAESLIRSLSHSAVIVLSVLASILFGGLVCYQIVLLRCAGVITLTQPFISQLVLLKRMYFVLAVVVTSPPLLLFALCPSGTGVVWFYVVAVELIVTTILYLREILNLFIVKKISILHWFLYLCIVEIFPFTFLWLIGRM